MKFIILSLMFLTACVSSQNKEQYLLKYSAFGESPNWKVEIHGEKLNLIMSENDKVGQEFATKPKGSLRVTFYEFENNSIAIQYAKCISKITKKEYKRKAIMFFRGKKYEGCAEIR